jgi:hypothetical protein
MNTAEIAPGIWGVFNRVYHHPNPHLLCTQMYRCVFFLFTIHADLRYIDKLFFALGGCILPFSNVFCFRETNKDREEILGSLHDPPLSDSLYHQDRYQLPMSVHR